MGRPISTGGVKAVIRVRFKFNPSTMRTFLLPLLGLTFTVIGNDGANKPEPAPQSPQVPDPDKRGQADPRAKPETGTPAEKHFATLLQKEANPDAKAKAMAALAAMRGDADSGEDVFGRACFTCHVVDDFGANLGPDLSDAGKRLSRLEIADSVINPNAKVDSKYYTVTISTSDGGEFTGFLESEDARSVTLRMGAELLKKIDKRTIAKRETVKTSTMTDDLAATLTAQEFVDLIEYLAAQK
jgi:putative heme-binding domain-containing protein